MKQAVILILLVMMLIFLSSCNELGVEDYTMEHYDTHQLKMDGFVHNIEGNDNDYIKISFKDLSGDVNNKLTVEYYPPYKWESIRLQSGWMVHSIIYYDSIVLRGSNGLVGYKISSKVTEGSDMITVQFPLESIEKVLNVKDRWVIIK